jgi:ABC-type multidrug transport system fused ATPase/permease subunit
MAFDHVYLTYRMIRKGQERNRRALRDVKIRIRHGEAIAVIGPNGAGKSSMVNLACRLYDPTGGQIRLDETPLEKIKLQQIREQICLITQHPILFNRSVADNIAFGLEEVSRERIIEAAKASGAHHFISQLPQDYDTYVGEQGRLLSGGERQKIVLARAFIRRPQILILDEPTTGLDRQTVEEFLDLVSSLHRQGMTIIYITHEFSQLSRFQRVFQLTPEKNVVEVEDPLALARSEVKNEPVAGH